MMRLLAFVVALGAWLFVVTYCLLAATMGGCTAAEPGCDTTHTTGLVEVAVFAVLSLAGLIWMFFLRRRGA
jgi:hypothetical protein